MGGGRSPSIGLSLFPVDLQGGFRQVGPEIAYLASTEVQRKRKSASYHREPTVKFFSKFRFISKQILAISSWALLSWLSQATFASVQVQPYVKALYSYPLTFDPSQMNDTASLVVSNLIYDGLLRFTSDLQFEGALAETWDVSSDGTLLTFKLRPGIQFHDGSPISALAVKKSLERLVRPKSRVYTYYDCIEGAESFHLGKAVSVSGIQAVGEDQVRIRLKKAFPPFLSVLAGATAKVLPLAAEGARFFNQPVGSGPFKIEALRNKAELQPSLFLKGFSHYWRGAPKMESLRLVELNEIDAIQWAHAGQLQDLANYPLTGTESVFKAGTDITAPAGATWIIGLNVRTAPFRSLAVRQKFKSDFDHEEFRKRFSPDSLPAYGYIPPGFPGHLREARSRPAVELIRNPDTRITIVIPSELARHDEMKDFIEAQYRRKGWNVKVRVAKWNDLMKGYSAKTHQAFLVSMNMDYPDSEFLIRNFESTNRDNFSGLKSKRIDELIQRARNSPDRHFRSKLYQTLAEELNDAAVTINLFHPRVHYWVSSCVEGFRANLLADVYLDYRDVSIRPNCVSPRVKK